MNGQRFFKGSVESTKRPDTDAPKNPPPPKPGAAEAQLNRLLDIIEDQMQYWVDHDGNARTLRELLVD